jgi:hypothetical protein
VNDHLTCVCSLIQPATDTDALVTEELTARWANSAQGSAGTTEAGALWEKNNKILDVYHTCATHRQQRSVYRGTIDGRLSFRADKVDDVVP